MDADAGRLDRRPYAGAGCVESLIANVCLGGWTGFGLHFGAHRSIYLLSSVTALYRAGWRVLLTAPVLSAGARARLRSRRAHLDLPSPLFRRQSSVAGAISGAVRFKLLRG